MFSQLHRHAIPFLIFSAGLGDIIELVIKQQSKMYDNIKVVSNYMDFNHQVRCIMTLFEILNPIGSLFHALTQSD